MQPDEWKIFFIVVVVIDNNDPILVDAVLLPNNSENTF